MKFVRFSSFLAIAGLFFLSLVTSCRHDSPTGPVDTTSTSDTGCCHGRITLNVTDSATGHALDGGSASLYENDQLVSSKTMNVNGTVWDGLCPGRYHFTVSKDGYQTSTFAIDSMGCNAVRTVNHVLDPVVANTGGDTCCHGVIEIAVKDSTNGENITGATVVLANRTTGVSYTKTSDNGNVRFDGLCPGNYLCTITNDGFSSSTFDFLQGCNETSGFTKSLIRNSTPPACDTASITVHVRDSVHRDTNLDSATVTIRIDGHSDNFTSGLTNADGYYSTVSDLPEPNSYIVTISKDGYNTSTTVIKMGDCRNYSETVYLSHK